MEISDRQWDIFGSSELRPHTCGRDTDFRVMAFIVMGLDGLTSAETVGFKKRFF